MSGTPVVQTLEFSDAIGEISQIRSKAEDIVKLLKSDYDVKCIPDGLYRETRLSYGDARAAFNTWITEITSALQNNKKLDKSLAKYNEALETTSNKGDAFVKKVETLYQTPSIKDCEGQKTVQTTPAVKSPTAQAQPSATTSKSAISALINLPAVALKKVFMPIILLGIGDTIFNDWQKYTADKRERLVKALENEKWKAFEDL